ncbi:permease-like cell division protein FtsX [Prolixibacteraceae bacterium Z1-6]|uniref:Cell division protein FtsX n=1 Tax=Draconibacterium aestuarii TaxID=2998507 RepID=A0A9X3J5J6_9BACT|nr:permease-like cell division protein FtsX [Prolixibacteraceae bacterium Z1-6]
MTTSKPTRLKKRFLNSWITSLISISLVLILLGILSLILINSRQLSDYVREKIGFTLLLKDDLKEVEIIRLQKVLTASDYVKSARFIDKETAAKELAKELGEDFIGFLGYNPLFASLDVKLYAPYTTTEKLQALEQQFLSYPQVSEVYYQRDLVSLINKNVRKISILLVTISALLTFIFFGLINNTIRILIYSQRFTINTMQMVGASKNFIRLPFLRRSLFLGAYGAVIANIILVTVIYIYQKEHYGLINNNDLTTTFFVVAIVFALGFIISFLSTWFAINKFLRLKFDELFY